MNTLQTFGYCILGVAVTAFLASVNASTQLSKIRKIGLYGLGALLVPFPAIWIKEIGPVLTWRWDFAMVGVFLILGALCAFKK